VSLRLECCVCGGRYPEALIGWWYAETKKALQLGADGDDVALVVVEVPELKRGHICSRLCARAFVGLTGGIVEASPYLRIRKAAEPRRAA
jgi:hypothetical protein